ncbi:MAG: hypothetical protein LBR05_10835 [Azoarcus sp.]|jgi:Ca2+-binding RTX toxin-like protein|nr:hypothetical protein [Azoarcus sp.]
MFGTVNHYDMYSTQYQYFYNNWYTSFSEYPPLQRHWFWDNYVELESSGIYVGSIGNDTIIGSAETDYLFGGSGNDVVYGGQGDDIINGGAGNDSIEGARGNDMMWGDLGSDSYYFYGFATGSDTIYESGFDTDYLVFSGGVQRENIFFQQQGNDLMVAIGRVDGDDVALTSTILIKDQFNSATSNGVEYIRIVGDPEVYALPT